MIPSHNVRAFSCAVGCLSRIGKELYIEFDPMQGLILRTLNDAKSSFCSFSFAPDFFEHCRVPLEQCNSSRKRRRRNEEEADMEENDASQNDKYICRVSVRMVHSILRPRKGLISLRIKSHESTNKQDSYSQISSASNFISQDSNHTSQTSNGIYQLSFEFLLSLQGILRITRRIPVGEATSLKAVASRDNSSHVLSHPKALLGLLTPIQKTTEVALGIQSQHQIISASSFHPGDTNEMVIATSNTGHCKTETTMGWDDLDECYFINDRDLDDDTNIIPQNVNEEVTLVFGMKEVKAMLQFCVQANKQEEDLRVTVYFEWGGRPMILEIEGEHYKGELIMATLDHSLLVGYPTR